MRLLLRSCDLFKTRLCFEAGYKIGRLLLEAVFMVYKILQWRVCWRLVFGGEGDSVVARNSEGLSSEGQRIVLLGYATEKSNAM